jgi:nicotinate phosphoribosyltransferase
MFYTATPEEILQGKVTDAYFARSDQIIRTKHLNKKVRAEFIAKGLPNNWTWAILAGVEECCEVFKKLPISVRAMTEGTIFSPYEPVMEIEGMYQDFGIFETALLGLICQASGVATKAARCKLAARGRPIISFGGRRVHPAIAPMIERNAYIGGCDGVAILKSAELINIPASGTMPHAFILLAGDTVTAAQMFDEIIDPNIKRVALIDTFNDEKFEAVRVAEALKERLYAIRLDTPASRRGDFYRILEEVRWELNLRGYDNIKIFISGGIDEHDITALNPMVDAYGVGTCISNAPVIDFAMDIIEIEGTPIAKRGKMSGAKDVLRCPRCGNDRVIPLGRLTGNCDCGAAYIHLLEPLYVAGEPVCQQRTPSEIRDYVIKQLERCSL